MDTADGDAHDDPELVAAVGIHAADDGDRVRAGGRSEQLSGTAAMIETTLDIDLLPLVEALNAVLEGEPSVVRQQQALELLIVKRALRMGNTDHARIIVDGTHKHATQLLAQLSEPQR